MTPIDAGSTLMGGAIGYLGEGYADLFRGLDPGQTGIGGALLGLSIAKFWRAATDARQRRSRKESEILSARNNAAREMRLLREKEEELALALSRLERRARTEGDLRYAKAMRLGLEASIRAEEGPETLVRAQSLIEALSGSPNMMSDLTQKRDDFEAGKIRIGELHEAIIRYSPVAP